MYSSLGTTRLQPRPQALLSPLSDTTEFIKVPGRKSLVLFIRINDLVSFLDMHSQFVLLFSLVTKEPGNKVSIF